MQLMPFSLGFILGDAWFQQLPTLPSWLFWIMAVVFMLLFRRIRKYFGFGFWCAWALAYLFAIYQLGLCRLDPLFQGKVVQLEGQIIDLVQDDDRKSRFNLALHDAPSGLPRIIRVSWYHPSPQLVAGQVWRLSLKINAVHGLSNPGGFDYEQWAFMQGIGASAYVKDTGANSLLSESRPWRNLAALRQSLIARMPDSKTLHYSGFIKALTLGDAREISDEQWQVLRQSGTLHLMVISGSHLTLVAGLIYFLVHRLLIYLKTESSSPQIISAYIAGLAVIIYAALAGYAVPVLRALVMVVVGLFGIIRQKHVGLPQLLVMAAVLILTLDPLAVLYKGFWLSFFAVGWIFYLTLARLSAENYWRGLFKVHIISALGLAPLLLLWFNQVSLIAPFANVIAVPVVGFILVPLGLLNLVLMFLLPTWAMWLWERMDKLLDCLYRFLSWISATPYAISPDLGISFPAALCALIGIFILAMPRGLPGRMLAVAFFMPLFSAKAQRLEPGEFKLTLLDIGQGLSASIQTVRHSLIFDTGIKFSERSDSAQSVIIPFLKFANIKRLDALIISHGDNDHHGGTGTLITHYPPLQIHTSISPIPEIPSIPQQDCANGKTWEWDGVMFKFLTPNLDLATSENDRSCVLRVSNGRRSLLLPGDIESAGEQWLVDNVTQDLRADILIAPHHGSKSSSSADFLKQVQPQLVLIPAGYRNRFGFPHQEVLDRYAALKAEWLNVADQGAISLFVSHEGYQWVSQREDNPHYWQTSSRTPN